MSGFICPFCNHAFALTNETISSRLLSFAYTHKNAPDIDRLHPYLVELVYYCCPNCNEQSVVVFGRGEKLKGIRRWIHPTSIAKQYPNYIPRQILSDYEEAAAIIDLSPKASATLSRRCLQGMIRDFWGIHDKRTLNQEINEIKVNIPGR